MGLQELEELRIYLSWSVLIYGLLASLGLLWQHLLSYDGMISEQVSLQLAFVLLKCVMTLQPGGNMSHSPLFGLLYLLQLICYLRILDASQTLGLRKVKMLLLVLFLFFTSQLYFYRSSHRERFSSLQFGKVCPGKGLCSPDLEWALMVLEAFSSHLLTMLFLPVFTLNYVSGNLSKKDEKSIELKIKRRLKRESN